MLIPYDWSLKPACIHIMPVQRKALTFSRSHGVQWSAMEGILKAWGLILGGYQPNLSIEITRECPLRCPGCYAYGDTHLGGDVVLRELTDYKGQALIDGVLDLVKRRRPMHVSIVGGEPLVRFRELEVIVPQLTGMGI